MNFFSDFLGQLLQSNGIDDYPNWVADIESAVQEGRFEWFYRNGVCAGFYTWVEKIKDGKQYIYVGNLFIEPKHRSVENVFKIRRKMKHKFPNSQMGYWINNKRKQFVYD